jgi:hypothetical protein
MAEVGGQKKSLEWSPCLSAPVRWISVPVANKASLKARKRAKARFLAALMKVLQP